MRLECVAGASFRDNVGSGALKYDTSKGAALYKSGGNGAGINIHTQFTQVFGAQVRDGADYGGQQAVKVDVGNVLIDSCILHTQQVGPLVFNQGSTARFVNCLLQVSQAPSSYVCNHFGTYFGCTVVNTGTVGGKAFESEYSAAVVKDCAVYGFTTFSNSATAAGSDYNSTDLASASTGTHNLTSQTFSNQFVSTTADFTPKSGNGLVAGVADATYLTLDILGTTRAGTPTIGCRESSASPPPPASFNAGWANATRTVGGVF